MYMYNKDEPDDTFEEYIKWRRTRGTPYYERNYNGSWEDWMGWDEKHHPAWKPGELEAHRKAKKLKQALMIAKEKGDKELIKKLEEMK